MEYRGGGGGGAVEVLESPYLSNHWLVELELASQPKCFPLHGKTTDVGFDWIHFVSYYCSSFPTLFPTFLFCPFDSSF